MLELNISGLSDASKITQESKLKIAIVGKPKTGKSWLAATAPGPVFVADFDQRAASLSGKAGVYVKTYSDLDPNNIRAMDELDQDLSMLEYSKQQGKEIPATYVFDSATYMRKAMEQALIKQHSKMGREIKVGGKSFQIGQGWDIVNGIRQYFEYIVGRASVLGHVIVVFHEQDEKDNVKSTKEEKAYTGRITIQPQYLESVLSIFNEVWRISIDYAGAYNVVVKPNNDFLASTTMKLDATEKPNIQDMLAKHRKAVG